MLIRFNSKEFLIIRIFFEFILAKIRLFNIISLAFNESNLSKKTILGEVKFTYIPEVQFSKSILLILLKETLLSRTKIEANILMKEPLLIEILYCI